MTDTPILALDVDGVLNVFLRGAIKEPFGDYRSINARPTVHDHEYEITFSPTVIKTLLDLHESGALEIVWLTTWGRGANGELSERIGLPGNFRVAGERPANAAFVPLETNSVSNEQDSWWKFTYIKRLAHEHPSRRIIWIDDDLSFDRDSVEWVNAQGNRVLGICPDTNLGLTPEDLEFIREFVEVGS